jgi:hypothetical protein
MQFNITEVTISVETANAVRQYLGQRPFDEVSAIVAQLETEAQASIEAQVKEASAASNVLPFPPAAPAPPETEA